MKSLQNITKETAYYRGKEITHAIGYDAYILELNKLDKKFGRERIGNSKIGFDIETAFVNYVGKEAHSCRAAWDAVGHDGKKWEIRTRNAANPNGSVHFMASTDSVQSPWKWAGQGEVFDYIKKKCDAVDMFLVADTSRIGEKGLIEWWEIPSKAIIELYNRDEWKCGKYRAGSGVPQWLSLSRFYNTMKWIFNK